MHELLLRAASVQWSLFQQGGVLWYSDCHSPLSDSSSAAAQPGLDRDSMRVITGSLSVPFHEQGEGRVVYIRNLSGDMSSRELKKRFEVFGEIVECQVLRRSKR